MDEFVKNIWGDDSPWKDSTAFFTYLRGCLRKAWSTNPIKINLIKKRRVQIPNPSPRAKRSTVWGCKCDVCGGYFVMKDIQIDHVVPAGKLSRVEDIQGFVERLLLVKESDLRVVCKNCHATITYAERMGVTFKEAKVVKTAIEIQKSKKDKEWLMERGHTPSPNMTGRREQIIGILKGENG